MTEREWGVEREFHRRMIPRQMAARRADNTNARGRDCGARQSQGRSPLLLLRKTFSGFALSRVSSRATLNKFVIEVIKVEVVRYIQSTMVTGQGQIP